MSTQFGVTVEFSVKGYVQNVQTYKAETIEEIKNKINHDANELHVEVRKSLEEHGDFRAYCPEFANGYPSAPFDGEEGSEVEITVLVFLEEVVTTIEVRDQRFTNLQDSIDSVD